MSRSARSMRNSTSVSGWPLHVPRPRVPGSSAVHSLACRTLALFLLAGTLHMPAGTLPDAHAQVPLSAVDRETTVRDISFKFVDGKTFEEDVLENQIWHKEPGFWDKVKRILPFVSMSEFPFDPVELQKDVSRLRLYYQRNGFLSPSVDYPASQVDTSANKIRILFTIQQGPPLIIQDVGFYDPEGNYAVGAFAEALRDDWINFRDDVTLRSGIRYTEFEGIRLQDEILTWLKNSGFTFAEVSRDTQIDSTANTVDLRFIVDPGPRGYISEIQIEGNESVARNVVLRELPFSVGDRFSAEKLAEGQQELFSLGLFRVAVSEVPEQPRDSTVVVRYQLREANPRNLSAQTGYALDEGANLQGGWTHRNFLGGARTFTASGIVNSGFAARRAAGLEATREFGGSVSIQQPYLFNRKLSGLFTPFYEWQDNPTQQLAYQEAGVRAAIIYTIYNFRTVTLQYSIVRSQPLGNRGIIELPSTGFVTDDDLAIYNRSVVTLSANLGNVDDYIRPTSGFLIRPQLEMGGQLVRMQDDVEYFKSRLELVGYLPITEEFNLTGRLYAGRIWPTGASRNQAPDDSTGRQTEFRFDRIRFYGGGPNDVRGWPNSLLGPKFAYRRVDPGDTLRVDYDFEPNGGLGKLAANVELRTPLPFFGPAWRGAVFVDMGQVFPTAENDSLLFDKERVSSVGFDLRDLRIGVGGGLRYQTLVGYIRLDLAYKVNPTIEDLASPEEIWRLQKQEIDRNDIETNWRDRFRFHLSIGQSF